MPRFDLNGGRAVSVLSEDAIKAKVRESDQYIAKDRDRCGNLGPSEAMVERRKDSHPSEEDEYEHHDDLLCRAFFGSRTNFHTSLQELGILNHQIYGEHNIAGKKDRGKHPRLPVVERPRGQKQQYACEWHKQQESYGYFFIQI